MIYNLVGKKLKMSKSKLERQKLEMCPLDEKNDLIKEILIG
jgi:hypothetical protein